MTATVSEILTLRLALVRALLLLEGQRRTKANTENAILSVHQAMRVVEAANSELTSEERARIDGVLERLHRDRENAAPRTPHPLRAPQPIRPGREGSRR